MGPGFWVSLQCRLLVTRWPSAQYGELSLRGHEVYVLTTDPQNDPRLVNLTEVSLRHCYKHKIQFEDQLEHLSNMEVVQEVRVMMGKVTEDFISNKQLQTWINESKRFDLVLVETFYPEFLILGEIFDCPKILICSLTHPLRFIDI